jgi:hypothetical protein
LILNHEHPNCDKDGYVLEHRLIMEHFLERYLKPSEIIHHKNHNSQDNRIENLELVDSNSRHISEHAKRRSRNAKGQFVAAC